MTQDRALSTLEGARHRLVMSAANQNTGIKLPAAQPRPKIGLGFMKIKFTNNRRMSINDDPKKLKKEEERNSRNNGRLPSMFSDVLTSLKSHKDRKLDKELHELMVRKRNRELEHFLSQRQFFMDKVFTSNNELRFSRFNKNQQGSSRSSSRYSSSDLDDSPSSSDRVSPTGSPSVTGAVTPSTPLHLPSDRQTPLGRSSSCARRIKVKKESPVLKLRDLLFLEESSEPPTPNRKRILQARSQMFGRHGNQLKTMQRRPITAPSGSPRYHNATTGSRKQPGDEKGVELSSLLQGSEKTRHVHFQNKVRFRRTQSQPLIQLEAEETDLKDASRSNMDNTGRSNHQESSDVTDINISAHCACSHKNIDPTDEHDLDRTTPHDLDDLERALQTPNGYRAEDENTTRQQGILLTTPTPRTNNHVTWSDTIVDPEKLSQGRASKVRFKVKHMISKVKHLDIPEEKVDLEAQERLLQRIMVTIPPDVIAKATAHAQNLSELMGYSQQKESLLELERKHGARLGSADHRFTRLMDILNK